MAFSIDGVISWAEAHWYIFLIAFGVYFVYAKWLSHPPKLKPVNRSEIERDNFIRRNKFNTSFYNDLYRGDKLIGHIISMRGTELFRVTRRGIEKDVAPENLKDLTVNQQLEELKKPIYEIIFKPIWNFYLFKMPNIFSKGEVIFIDANTTRKNEAKKWLEIDRAATFDKAFGIYYDRRYEEESEEFIKVNTIFRTDLENLTSIYYAKAQEQSTIQPDFAHETLGKQQDIELEKQKRARIGG